MRLSDIIPAVMDVVFIGFAIYGIFVFRKWRKVAVKTDSMLDEMHDEINEGDTEYMPASKPCDHEFAPCEYYYDDGWGCKGRELFGNNGRVGYLRYCKKCGALFVWWDDSHGERKEGADNG